MAKNRKTVRKVFTYLQCDDFADYLSRMAAQGWHFKEWGTGLVFEKGEPEKAVYAVEVFIDGSDYDLRPGDHTLNFGDYCEEAGWQLVDAKQKFCIFKQIREDAVPIVTPEERLKNASKAYRKQLIWQVVLSIMWISSMLLRVLPKSQLINTLFSGVDLVFSVYWLFYALYTTAKCIWFAAWLYKAKKRCEQGETKLLCQGKNKHTTWVSILSILGLSVGIAASGEYWLVLVMLGTIPIIYIPSLLMAKYRPDRETNIGFQIVFPIVFAILIPITVIFVMAGFDIDSPSSDTFPLVYKDLEISAGEVKDTFHTSSSSIFGTKDYYSLGYTDGALTYVVYQTEQEWILDTVWDYEQSRKWYGDATDCTAIWHAEMARRSNSGRYIVRFDDAILVFYSFDDTQLSEEQTAIIRCALALGD